MTQGGGVRFRRTASASRRRRSAPPPFRRFPPIHSARTDPRTLVHHHYTNAARNYSFRRLKQTNDPPAMIFDPRSPASDVTSISRTCTRTAREIALFSLPLVPSSSSCPPHIRPRTKRKELLYFLTKCTF